MEDDTIETVDTFTATIYVGLSEIVHTFASGKNVYNTNSIDVVERVVQEYVDEVKLCVTVMPTKYIYTKGIEEGSGFEEGAIVGLINCPHSPSNPSNIEEHAMALARKLRLELKQRRVTVVFTDYTVTIGTNK